MQERGSLMAQLYLSTCFWEGVKEGNYNDVMTFLSTASAVITVIMTFIIFRITDGLQKKQAAAQSWESLITEYRKSDFGIAVKAVIDFYIEDCDRCLSKIRDKYIERYRKDFSNMASVDKTVVEITVTGGAATEKTVIEKSTSDKTATLHFYRRLLEEYYWQLWLCIDSEGFDSDLISQYFNKNEMNIIVIVYYMGKAASVPEIYKSILPCQKEETGEDKDIAKALRELYAYFGKIFKPDEDAVLHF